MAVAGHMPQKTGEPAVRQRSNYDARAAVLQEPNESRAEGYLKHNLEK